MIDTFLAIDQKWDPNFGDWAMDMRLSWEARLGIFLTLLSLTIYYIKYLIIRDPENVFNYLFNYFTLKVICPRMCCS